MSRLCSAGRWPASERFDSHPNGAEVEEAMDEDFVAWPFPILKPEAEWDEFDRDLLEFLRTAHAEGFQPGRGPGGAVAAGGRPGRWIYLIFRGVRNGWEPGFGDGNHAVRLGSVFNLPLGDSACVCIRPPFRGAAQFALGWLRGRALTSLLADFEFVGGYPAGIRPRPDAWRGDFA